MRRIPLCVPIRQQELIFRGHPFRPLPQLPCLPEKKTAGQKEQQRQKPIHQCVLRIMQKSGCHGVSFRFKVQGFNRFYGDSGGFTEIEGSGRSCSGIRYLTYDVSLWEGAP